jgi:hypothetical protein
VYTLLNPNVPGGSALHFESTFFFSTSPFIVGFLIVMIIITAIFSSPGLNRHKGTSSTRG